MLHIYRVIHITYILCITNKKGKVLGNSFIGARVLDLELTVPEVTENVRITYIP